MTLHKQLLVTVLAIFAILLATVFSVELNNSTEHLVEQQESNVTNTSTTLGLSLTPYLETEDSVGAESVINVVFDGGFYQQISLELMASNTTIERTNPVHIDGVPEWFVDLDLFQPVVKETILTSGWLQLGKLQVVGHPGYAYRELWSSLLELTKWFIVAFLVSTLLVIWSLRFILKPLVQIKERAEAIQKNRFGEPIPLPKTQELREVVKAINAMTANLAEQFSEQATEAESLRNQVYRDATSGLGNRAYFMGLANAWSSESGSGGIALLALDILDEIYREEGFAARDELVRLSADTLKRVLSVDDEFAVARISANEFAILLPGLEKDQLMEIANQIQAALSELVISPIETAPSISVMGIAERLAGESVVDLLTNADNALQVARADRGKAVHLIGGKQTDTMGRVGWKHLVQDAVHSKHFVFKAQPALSKDGKTQLHAELFASIERDGKRYFAGQFMPAVEQFKLGSLFDQHILQLSLAKLAEDPDRILAVNLTMSACVDADFHEWLKRFMAKQKDIKGRLLFEISETVCVSRKAEVAPLIQLIHDAGYKFGIDHYGRHFQSLGYLEEFNPSYVKVDHSYTSQILETEGDIQFLGAVCRAAHKLNITTIATRVESQIQLEQLADLHIDGYQGFISPPKPL